MSVRRILWTTDFSESDLDSLAKAGELARAWQAELVALHVIGDVAEEVYGEKSREGKDRAAWALWKISKENAEKRLDDLVAKALPDVPHRRVMTAFGDPTTRILDVVRDLEIGLVVMAARRDKSLLEEMLLGSVAYKVVRTAPCSVTLVK